MAKLIFNKSLLICFVLLVSCAKRVQITDQDKLRIRIELARLADVPMPFGIKPVLACISERSFGYLLDDLDFDLAAYYLRELDQTGWNLIGNFTGIEHNLIFEKPHKLISINIRQQDQKRFVLILTSDK